MTTPRPSNVSPFQTRLTTARPTSARRDGDPHPRVHLLAADEPHPQDDQHRCEVLDQQGDAERQPGDRHVVRQLQRRRRRRVRARRSAGARCRAGACRADGGRTRRTATKTRVAPVMRSVVNISGVSGVAIATRETPPLRPNSDRGDEDQPVAEAGVARRHALIVSVVRGDKVGQHERSQRTARTRRHPRLQARQGRCGREPQAVEQREPLRAAARA